MSGDWPPGFRIPFEHELMTNYGCSRMTVNKALSALAVAGLVERKKRAGTFVARPRVHSMVLDVPDLAEQIQSRGQSYRYEPIKRVIRARTPSDVLDIGSGRALVLDGLHLADGNPFALEHRLISLKAVPSATDADFELEAPGTWLLRHIPWTEAETRISAVEADETTAGLLRVKIGSACLLVERATWRGQERVTSVRQHFLGTAYDLIARFNAGKAVPNLT